MKIQDASMKSKILSKRNKKLKETRLFHFTKEEEERILQAKHEAVEYMAVYGKGREPYMVDFRHYKS